MTGHDHDDRVLCRSRVRVGQVTLFIKFRLGLDQEIRSPDAWL